MGVTVEELLDVPFFSRSREEKRLIVHEGKPRPPFTLSVVTVRQSNGQVVQAQHYDQGLYDLLPWLTRCDKRRCFFCWPCLLFMTGKQWSETGVPDGQFLVGGVYDHENSAEHLQSMLDWQMFIKHYLKPEEAERLRMRHIATVKKNQEILIRVIDAICNVVVRAQPLKETDYYNQLSKKECISVLEFIRNYDIQFIDHIDEAICLLNVHPKFVDDVVDAITRVIRNAIQRETQLSTYVSVILSEHSEISSRSQMSTILRYIKDGKVCERFIGFTNLPTSKDADVALKTFRNITTDFAIKERFLAYSVDAAVVHSTKVRDLHIMLKTEFPFSFFSPYHSHGLDFILQQSISHIKECGLLFRMLNEIGNYFQKNSSQWKEFERFMFQKMPYLETTKWFKRSQLIKVINTYRKYFIEYFAIVEINCKSAEAEDLVKIRGFRLYLEDFETVFLIRVLARMFEITAFVNSLVKSHTPEQAFDFAGIQNLLRTLKKELDTGFEKIWLHVVVENMKEREDDYATKRKRKTYAYREIFNKIVSLMMQEIENRFSHLHELEFCYFLNYEKCNEKSMNEYLNKLVSAHQPYFDKEQLKLEYMVLRNNGYAAKPISEILEFFTSVNLKTTFPYLSKLAELVLTLPYRRVANDTPSKLKKLEKWSYISEEDNIPGDASVLFIEKEFLQEVKKNDSFHEEVIYAFTELSNYIDLRLSI